MDKFKKIFLQLRLSKGFNQEEMSKALGISKSTIAMWETGKRFPSPDMVELIADYFNVDIDYLYGRTDIKRKVIYDEFGDEYTNNNQLSHKDQKEITKILSDTEALLNQEGLMFDGEPASEESISSIISAMKIGMEMAKKNNKKYTPNKYKKD
ncbi:MAG: helix-turn-helix domain-containing protein [Candidatus Pseudoruminococcus sp.]|nr:helix-turn-helix domain-containing protein [Candidatus Pseudoruminococcus sp.]